MICRADEHYSVLREGTGSDSRVTSLKCVRCVFQVFRSEVSGNNAPGWTGGRSGTPRYNRMRAKMVRHIHERHIPWTKEQVSHG